MSSDAFQDLGDYLREYDRDVYIYNGRITHRSSLDFAQRVLFRGLRSGRKRATLLLITYGGDPHAAYRIGRSLKRMYDEITILLTSTCASAGTLVAMSADELSFFPTGELGPLDVQVPREDDMLFRLGSGLDTTEAMAAVVERTWQAFDILFPRILRASDGGLTTQTAADIVLSLVSSMVKPVASQIDPHRLARFDRIMEITTHYAERLNSGNAKPGTISKLARSYPDHSFIIDEQEAAELFENVRPMNDEEGQFVVKLSDILGAPVWEPLVDDILLESLDDLASSSTSPNHLGGTDDPNEQGTSPGATERGRPSTQEPAHPTPEIDTKPDDGGATPARGEPPKADDNAPPATH